MSLAPDQLRALDQLRSRLAQLSETLGNTVRDIHAHDPLPTWPQMQSLQMSLSFTLNQVHETLKRNAKLLKEAHVYPTSSFPGHKESELAFLLLRKKLAPPGEAWLEEMTDGFHADGPDGYDSKESEDLWSWAMGCSQDVVGPMLESEDFGGPFTFAEVEDGVENVRTGLKRKLYEEESGDEGDGEDEKMEEDSMPEEKEEGVDPEMKPLPMEGVLRFVTTGAVPVRPNK